ncbi:DUF1272 domain-containing protein [Congregibacter sp.]|uniref:DUF1272 domain-containing protein n=1 Tax=Congregibacter sp. TaxID=2744308 RepID=UPI003F6CF7B4
MLEMKTACEHCQKRLDHEDEAYICSYECTYCKSCTVSFDTTCPNCQGSLLRRPPRQARKEGSPSTVSRGDPLK